MKNRNPLCFVFTSVIVFSNWMVMPSVIAQEEPVRVGMSGALVEEIVVTARKREELALDVPLSVSVYGADQIEALKVRDLSSLAVNMPNVALDDLGTTRGTANFSIRGLGVNSSIASIDPTVGVFVDGVYMGVNSGIVFDTFDLASIEVLRGPQGILFGRNVTGGAVLINTKKPSNEFEASLRASLEGGGEKLNSYLMGSVSGPLSENLAGRLTVYTNQDDGWFKNRATGKAHGEADTVMFRPSLIWSPTDTLELTLRYEYQDIEGDGPAAQNHTNGLGIGNAITNFDRDSHKFAINEPGSQETEIHFFNGKLDCDVAFGEGTVTYIFGWRDFSDLSLADIDATAISLLHIGAETLAEQFSNELRYNGLFAGKLNLTAGLYQFTNEVNYAEGRLLLGALTPTGAPASTQHGGGDYEVDTFGVFVAIDYDLTEQLTLTAGLRYTSEEKEADIATLTRNLDAPCDIVAGTCPIDFRDNENWSNISPKLGLTYDLTEELRLYGHWTRGFRSGGYNLRNAAIDTVNLGPGPFNEEQVDNFEIGFKVGLAGRGYINGAVFYNQVEDMQREINLADPFAGVVQLIRNTADAELLGLELDGTLTLVDGLVLIASIGYVDAEYSDIRFDLNGDGQLNGLDKKLELPRAAKWTYSAGLVHDLALGNWGYLSSRISYSYRDDSAYTDNNFGFLTDQEILDAGVDVYSNDGHWSIGVYGKNLLDDVKHGGDTVLPSVLGPVPLGGTFSPLAKGRVFGVEVTYNF